MMIKQQPRNAFSLSELLAAVVIISVVSIATISTITPLRARAHIAANERKLADLNSLSKAYHAAHQKFPPNGIVSMIEVGLYPGAIPVDPSELATTLRDFRYEATKGEFSLR
jgi:prepilin-type N-terminal cleavage/methylation domain-containing protein